MRILSLIPSATEIVAALGCVDALVGVTHACDFPPGVERLPRVTRTAIDSAASPAAIDRAVRELDAAGTPLYELDETTVLTLAPDVIITQAVCDVCAVSEHDVRAVAARLRAPARVLALGATTIEGVLDDIRAVARAIGVPDAGEALVAEAEARMRRVHETLKTARAPRPRVAVLEWTDPVFNAGHWVPQMVRRAGGIDVLGEPGARSRVVPLPDVRAADPDTVVLAQCGYDVRRAADEGRALLARHEWEWLRDRRVWALDANALASRPGPRLVDGVETLAALLHPALFAPPSAGQAVPVAA
jgi:iron complex transport system substrate-binding protein